MPDQLRAQLEARAKASGRSLHAEIVARLEQSLEADIQAFIHGTSLSQPHLLQQVVEYQRAVTALLLTLEEGVEILEEELPVEKRDQHPLHHFLHNAENLVHDVKRDLKKYGSSK
jgi:hypothetical protein